MRPPIHNSTPVAVQATGTTAKPGDLVIEASTDDEGNTRISRPNPILHRRNIGNKTWFHLKTTHCEEDYYPWKESYVEECFGKLGVSNKIPKSSRELTGKALKILPHLQRRNQGMVAGKKK